MTPTPRVGRILGLILASLCLMIAAPAWAEPAVGEWSGVLRPPGAAMRLNFHLSQNAQGKLNGYLISLDQGGANLVFDTIVATDTTLHLEASRTKALFDGKWDPAQQLWVGAWVQNGHSLPLSLRRGANTLPIRAPRPQRPLPPFPYRQEEVTFDSPAAHLAGTLTLPEGDGPFAAAILIAGSGPHTRNERILDHQPFLVLADALTRRGIAVLRYDKRGTGSSFGDYQAATTADFAVDVTAAVAFLRTRKDIAPGKVGLIGHSEGGLIAPMVASADPSIAFLVLLAGPGVDGKAVALEQERAIRIANGASLQAAATAMEANRKLLDLVLSGASDKQVVQAARGGAVTQDAPDQPSPLAGQLVWMRYFLRYDPRPALEKLRMPVLAMIGSKDLQVVASQNLPPLRQALAGDPKAKVLEMPGLNHLFQTAGTGSPNEYGKIEETFAPVALQTVTDWVVGETR